MKTPKRIIVGIDAFAKVGNILKRAVCLAEECSSRLYVVYAVETPMLSIPSYFGSKGVTIDKEGIRKRIEKKMKKADPDAKVPFTVLVKEGNADDIILYESRLINADMIVIGANTKNRRSFLGTTAEKVAQQSHLPLLLVRNSAKEPYRQILAPTDFGTQSKQSVLFAKSIYPSARIKAVHAYESFYTVGIYTAGSYTLENLDIVQYSEAIKSTAQNNMKAFIQEVGIRKGKVIDGDINSRDALVGYIKKSKPDLVVMGSRGTTGVKMLLGSMTSSLLRAVKTDVLIYVP